MADESKPEGVPWDEPDWVTDRSRRAGEKQPRGVPWVAIGVVVGLVLLAGTFTAVRYARMQAAQEAAMAEQAALAAQQAHVAVQIPESFPQPPREPETPQDPAEAMRLMAVDARALNNLGVFHLKLNQFEQAIDAFRKAAALDPQYADNVKMALERQEQFDRTAPPPREVEKP